MRLLTKEEINKAAEPYIEDGKTVVYNAKGVAKAQHQQDLKDIINELESDSCFNEDYCDGSGEWCVTFSKKLWQSLKQLVG